MQKIKPSFVDTYIFRSMATLIPRRFRAAIQDEPSEPSWWQLRATALLQAVSNWSCTYPIYTIVGIFLLAGATYVRLVEDSVFDAFCNSSGITGQPDTSSFLYGSWSLRLGEQTAWQWRIEAGTRLVESDVSYLFTFPLCLQPS